MSARVIELGDVNEVSEVLLGQPAPRVRLVMVLLTLLVATCAGWLYLTRVDLVVRAQGRVRPMNDEVRLATTVSGERVVAPIAARVLRVAVSPGQLIEAGDLVLELDTTRLEHEIARVESTLHAEREELTRLSSLDEVLAAQERAALDKQRHQIDEARQLFERELERRRRQLATARQEVKLAELEVTSADDEERRLTELSEQGLEPKHKAVNAERAHRQAVLRLDLARQALDVNASEIAAAKTRVEGVRAEEEIIRQEYAARRAEVTLRIESKRGTIGALEQSLDALQYDREHASVRSPVRGVVTGLSLGAGDHAEAGKSLATIAPEGRLAVDAAVTGADVALLRPGMRARVRLDAYDYRDYGCAEGTVEYISPDAQPLGDDKGGTAYAIRVALDSEKLSRGEREGVLQLGMTGSVEVVTAEERLLALLVRRVRQAVSLR